MISWHRYARSLAVLPGESTRTREHGNKRKEFNPLTRGKRLLDFRRAGIQRGILPRNAGASLYMPKEMSAMRGVLRLPGLLVRGLLIFLIRAYQLLISPWIGPHCRYEPSCSHYFAEALQKYGVIKGSAKGIRRILRCHPWHKGGYDPP